MRLFLPGVIIELIGLICFVTGVVTNSVWGIGVGIGLMVSAIAVHIFQIKKTGCFSSRTVGPNNIDDSHLSTIPDSDKVLYSDGLVTVSETAITFNNYTLLLKPRIMKFTDIDHIDVFLPAMTTGKYRIWGSGNFTMWFPLDSSRSSRDRIFHAYLKCRGMNVGFTVEQSGVVTTILRSKGLIGTDEYPR